MPVIRPPVSEPATRAALVRRLADELGTDPVSNPNGEPLVFENPIHPTDKVFVVVVWSAWESVAWPERPRLIADAYALYDTERPGEPPRLPAVATATGITWSEADANAFFKYAIEPNARAGEVDPDEVRMVMLDEGGYITPSGVRLRFMLRGPAENAYTRVRQRLPAAHWSLAELIRSRD